MVGSSQPDEAGAESGQVLIKKYSNRRLYDTHRSRYITLEDLAQIVLTSVDVRVVDAKTGRDLTRQVLTQVILEQQDRLDLIPIELLHAIIRVQGTLQQGPFSSFLTGFTRQFTHGGHLWAQQMQSKFGTFGDSNATGEHPIVTEPTEDENPIKERMSALLKRLHRSE